MPFSTRPVLGAIALCILAGEVHAAEVSLDALFGDHMVLQRDQPIRVWGRAEAGTAVTVVLGESSTTASADAQGAWSLALPAMPAGGPFELQLRRGDVVVRRVADVLVGDLFLCSGQSNMEWPVSRSSGAWGELLAPHGQIRLLTIAKDTYPAPRSDHATAPSWQPATADTIPHFSAVCWFMARDLHGDVDVPMGLVNASWGGSQIEAWMSEASLRGVNGFGDQLDLLQAYAEDRGAGSRRFGATWESWWRDIAPGPAPWEDGQGGDGWQPVPSGMGDWKAYGDAEIADHLGMLWFRNDFELTTAQANQAAVLELGNVDEVDATWVSGQFAGAGFGWGTPRDYALPAGALRAGRNSVTVNVLNTWGQGGLLGPPGNVGLRLANGEFVPLGSGWKYAKPAVDGWPPRAPWESVGGLTGMYNAMIAPLEGMKFAGAAWYQGESNAGRGRAYEALLGAMIADWRQLFGHPFLPFVVVQLPGFGAMSAEPVESGWAELRESQRRVAVADPHTGLAPIMDVGDPYDIHPANKQVVGRRVAGVMRSLLYGADGLPDGLSAVSARREGDHVVVDFSATGAQPVVHGSGAPAGFELCGDEAGSCAWADAELDGTLVRLRGDNAATATRVRHAWSETPIVNLFSADGLPAGSFEVPVSD